MKLFQKFKNHPEGFYSDSTVQTFNYRKESEILLLKRQRKLKRRERKASGKRVHRKEFESRMQSIVANQNDMPPDSGATDHLEEPSRKKKRVCNSMLSQGLVSYSQNLFKIVGMAVAAEVLS